MDELRQTGEAPLATLGPRGTGRRYQQYSSPCDCHNTQLRPQPPTQSPPQPAPHCPPRPLEGRFCARVVSWDPLCASAGHPPGVDSSSPPPPRRNLEIGYNAQERQTLLWVGPQPPTQILLCGPRGRRLGDRPVHPGWTFVFRSCQCLTSGVLAQGGEKGGFKLGTGRNLFFGLAAPPPPPQTLGGQTAQRGRGVGRTTGHSPSCRGTERNPAAAQPPGQPGQAVSLLGGLAAGRGPGGHLGASREPRGRCWWWRSGWGQTRAQGTLGRR